MNKVYAIVKTLVNPMEEFSSIEEIYSDKYSAQLRVSEMPKTTECYRYDTVSYEIKEFELKGPDLVKELDNIIVSSAIGMLHRAGITLEEAEEMYNVGR